jgi:cellulase/cellobiase CelA1
MRYTKRELRLAATAAVLAGLVVALLVVVLRGTARPPTAPARVGGTHPPAASAAPAPRPTSAGPRVLTAGYTVRGRWAGGFNAELVITNLSAQPVEGWTVELRMPDGTSVTGAWAADLHQAATTVILRSQPWNTYLAPGATVHLGFQATGEATAPRSCTVNGAPC